MRFLNFFFTVRSFLLNVITLGCWRELSGITMMLYDDLGKQKEEIGLLRYRLDCYMRFLEQEIYVVTPAEIEPPRLTAHGEGLTVEEEQKIVQDEVDRMRREQAAGPCKECGGSCFVRPKLGTPAEGERQAYGPKIVCNVCGGSGVGKPAFGFVPQA